MRTIRDGWLGRGCIGFAFFVAGCGGATESPLVQGDASNVGDGGSSNPPSKDSGARQTDAGSAADTRGTTDVTVVGDVAVPNDVTTGPSPDVVSLPDVVVIMNPDASPPPPVDAGAGCPGAAPMNFSMCMTAGQTCDYGTNDCTCSAGMRWTCKTCPATQPTAGSMCQGGGGVGGFGGGTTCTYGATDCVCNGGTWSCDTCPAAEPANASMCTVAGMACDYDAGTCRCGGATVGGGGMGNEAWRCQDSCPSAEPMPGDMCNTGTQQCTYGMTNCVCVMGAFFCN